MRDDPIHRVRIRGSPHGGVLRLGAGPGEAPPGQSPTSGASTATNGGRHESSSSNAWTMRSLCSCTRTASRRCRCARRRSSGTCRRRPLPGATSTSTRSTGDALEMRAVLEAIVTHPQGVDAADARRDPALHEAVLDQQRAVSQPDGAEVRAQDHAAGVRGGREERRAGRRDVPGGRGRIARRAAGAAAADVLRPERSIRSSPTRRQALARTS